MRTVLIAAAAVLAGHTVSAQTVDPAFQEARAAGMPRSWQATRRA